MSTASLPTRESWLAERQTGIGGSDAAAALGVSPWKSTFELWSEKTGLVEPPDLSQNEAIEWGLRLEEPIGKAVAERTGRAVSLVPPYTLERHREHAWMLATLDGTVLAHEMADLGPGVFQIKTTSAYRSHDWDDEPPLHYVVQVQHEMAVAGLAWGCLVVLIGGQRLRYFDMPRNDRFIETMIQREAAFWQMVQDGTPPEPDASEATAKALAKLYPKHDDGSTIALPPGAIGWDKELVEVKAQIKDLEEQKRQLENNFKAAMAKAEFGILPDGTRYSLKLTEQNVSAHTRSFRQLRRLK